MSSPSNIRSNSIGKDVGQLLRNPAPPIDPKRFGFTLPNYPGTTTENQKLPFPSTGKDKIWEALRNFRMGKVQQVNQGIAGNPNDAVKAAIQRRLQQSSQNRVY